MRGEETNVTQTFLWRGPLAIGAVGDIFESVVLGKNSYFNAIWIIFSTFLEPFEITKFLRFESQLKK